ncbi:hypothetical protein BRADI_2g07303v3 [Brachypodium distachyon]|uniref:Uncharacterized protein n=1 Tax=Brachypodium distachyon TaxID=15368 RepID=A0A0Q3JY00_BRADI|nr:hypothetical protein BRADI_2g07303v3 [Brachypodium distachyon]
MADQTQGAVDSLVGLLSTAIKDEARLLGGVQGDMQFIKDEMESMNGFLLHLTKTDGDHDDQLRAWMKQVRDIAYIAHDCIERYKLDCPGPPGKGLLAFLLYLPTLLRSVPARHRLANRIRELKVRVHDVGERRQRYDVKVPDAKKAQQRPGEGQAKQDDVDNREYFLRALAHDRQQEAPSFDKAIGLLPNEDLRSAARTVRDGLQKYCSRMDHRAMCMEMLLRALRSHNSLGGRTARTMKEVKELVKEEEEENADLPGEVMVFCYSKLSRSYKSCLQYLSTFRDEAVISRTSLVRRWVAEGIVEKQGEGSIDEAAEHCFRELLFRGFLVVVDRGIAGSKVKSCKVDDTVWGFVDLMSKNENFVSTLPAHLENQLCIRRFAQEQQQQPEEDGQRTICGFSRRRDGTRPMDKLVRFLKCLPQNYRLNVLDLGGCRGLRKSHLKSICTVLTLKYLSLRKTGVPHLPKQISKLIFLETLDIRGTLVRQDTKHIFLPRLKHLLASPTMTEEKEPPGACVPCKIGRMREVEILSRFDAAAQQELEDIGALPQLRKLGVVLNATAIKEAQENMIRHLLMAISKLSPSLRSLSVWIIPPNDSDTVDMEMNKGHYNKPTLLESISISGLGCAEMPQWILELQHLSKITLCDTSLSPQSLQNLGKKLLNLRCLRLRRNSYKECKLVFTKEGFRVLRFLMVEGEDVTNIDFEEEGAAPMLERIVWRNSSMDMTKKGSLSGIDRLHRIEKVELNGHFSDLSSIEASIGSKLSRG